MSRLLHKLLFVLISISFFISAMELDIGDGHNTFFDDHDTYVKTEDISSSFGTADAHFPVAIDLTHFTDFHLVERLIQASSCDQISDPEYHSTLKLNIFNSVWRI